MSGFEGGDQGWGSRSGVKVMRKKSVVKVGVMISGSKVSVKVGGSSLGSRSGVNGMEWNGMEWNSIMSPTYPPH